MLCVAACLAAFVPALAQSNLSPVPTPEIVAGGDLVVPLRLDPAEAVTSIDFTLQFDPMVLQASAVYTTDYTHAFTLTADFSQADSVQVTLNSVAPLVGNGEIAWVVFNAVGAAGDSSTLSWSAVSLNGGDIPVTTTDGQVDVVATAGTISVADDANGAPGMNVFVPLDAVSIDGWTDASIEFHYDPRILQALAVSTTALASTFSLGFDVGTPGVLTISLSGGSGATGSGSILNVLFRVTGAIGDVSPLALIQATVNGSPMPVDDGLFTICADADGDGVTECGGDCLDLEADVYPGAPEICDFLDNQCPGDAGHGLIDEGFDGDSDTYTSCGGDCDDQDPMVNPNAVEICDGVDNNCDGSVDETFADVDGDGIADCVDCAPNDPTNPQQPPVGNSVTLSKSAPGASADISWNDDGVPGPFRLYRGFLKAGSGFSYNAVCLGSPIAGTTTSDDLEPLTGTVFFYRLARGTCDESILGVDSAGAAIPNNDPCPSTGADADGDGTIEVIDTCPGLSDVDQIDTDGDSHGDPCDNCALIFNPQQGNLDGDALGDVCDPDDDQDGVDDIDDNCPRIPNTDQADADGDAVGDVCDNCLIRANADQRDSDLDGIGDACSGPVPDTSPGAVNFGDVDQGEMLDRSVTLGNFGSEALTVDAINLVAGSDPTFNIVTAPALPSTLQPGEILIADVRFAPTEVGAVAGTLRFGFSDAGLGDLDVPLDGAGVEPLAAIALAVSPTSVTRPVGECQQLIATAELAGPTFVDVTASATWSSDTPGVASVGPSGLLELHDDGMAIVTATLGVVFGQTMITVQPLGSLRIAPFCGELAPGQTFDAEITVDTGAAPLGSYAIRILYNPGVLRILGVAGGTEPSFVAPPDVNPSDLASGDTLITAYQATSLDVPLGVVSIATVTFEVVGGAGTFSTIQLAADTLAGTDLSDIPWTSVPVSAEVAP